MKTVEQKAIAYDEALERARLSRLQLLDIGEEATEIEYIFPELVESEDERISKEIIKYLEQTVPHNHRDEVLKSKEWIAWLENQGKEKPLSENEYERVIKALKEGFKYHQLFNPTIVNWLEKQARVESDKDDIEIEEKDIRKAFNKIWNEEDDYMLESIVSDFAAGHKSSIGQDKWLKSLKDRYTWKPSKEQMDALNCARWNAPFNIEILDSLYNDLKKLKEE